MIRMDTAPAARGVWKKLGGRLATPLLWGAATLILCAAQAFGRPLPLAAGAILLAGASPGGLLAAAGAIGGYLLLWGWEAAMEPLALSLSFLAAAVIFRKTPISLQYLSAGLGSLTATRLRKCEKALCRLIFLSIFTFCCCSTPGTML